MKECKKCHNDTFGVREKCHFPITTAESEKIFLIEVAENEKNKAITSQIERTAE